MNIKLISAFFSIVIIFASSSASAQKNYDEGIITLNVSLPTKSPAPNVLQLKYYFRSDSGACTFSMNGVGYVKFLQDTKEQFFAILINRPDSSIKKAGIASPTIIKAELSGLPHFTFTYTTETKQISGFNCKKVIATDSLTKEIYNVWITNDITLPVTAIPKSYKNIRGVPIQYTSFNAGATSENTVLNITGEKAPPGTFSIAADYKKMPIEELIGPMIKM
jgi:hypothetical protein